MKNVLFMRIRRSIVAMMLFCVTAVIAAPGVPDAVLAGDLTGADLRKVDASVEVDHQNLTVKNTIWTDGSVVNFEMDSADDFLHVSEGVETAAVIDGAAATVSHDGVTVADGAKLRIQNSTLLFDMMMFGDAGVFHIGEQSSVEFGADSELIFDFGEMFIDAEEKVLFIKGGAVSAYAGYNDTTVLVIGANVNGFEGSLREEEGGLYLVKEGYYVPEPSTAMLAVAGIGLLIRRRSRP